MLNIVFLDKSTVGDVPNIEKLGKFGKLALYDTSTPSEALTRAADADIIVTNKVVIDRSIMDNAPRLRLICVTATGMNNIDLDYAGKMGIPVKNVAGYSTNSVAQTTFTMLFYLMGQVKYYDDYVKSGRYAGSPIFTHFARPFIELHGKIFGIIGLGTIGKKVATIARSFGSEIIYYSTSGKNHDLAYKEVGLPELLSRSDIISIHAPLNDNTRNLIGRTELSNMKPTAYLVNAGRGGIVNETDLADALDKNLIAGAALDVLTKEPIAPDNPLTRVRNKDRLLIMPHNAWASLEARTVLIDKVCENIEEFIININRSR
ncbi:MAG TPA: D-2-hydroxyacid dehydrogenase [Cyclobacteriaceae bacterium]|nr:D-2-hydroxyacid dehydrogenase [Cyclobacteriaceae bacterium]